VLISADLLISKPPNIPSKRSGNDRLIKEVDDVFALITHSDESRMFSSLPVYVADDPDGMPSSRLYEGDLRGLMAHLSKLDQKVAIFDEKLNSVVQHLHMYTSSWPSPGAEPGPSAKSVEMSAQLRMSHSRDKQQPASVDWASTVDELNESVHSDDDVDGEPWQVQRSKRQRRSKCNQQQRQHVAEAGRYSVPSSNVLNSAPTVAVESSRPTHQRSSTSRTSTGDDDVRSNSNHQQHRRQQQQQQQRSAGRKSVTVIGRKNTTHGKITAARPYVAKSVYCVDNVVKDVSESDMESFLRRNGISVITCHAVKPRRSAWQRHPGIIPVDTAAFRICIAREDSDRLLACSRLCVVLAF